ncbi:MAG: hypothetical protein J6Y22_09255 [Paludibacteraceae bacterium]|jgi:hypothetical protein|nr:hypothetical protein [Paludibacteraceae bacterium]
MKKILFLLMTLFCANAAIAQNEVSTVILQHGDEVTMYKGLSAFSEAMEAATDNDVITLSKGLFSAAPINKSVRIYGAGYETDSTNSMEVSKLSGDVIIGVENDTLSALHMEGIYINGSIYAATNKDGDTLEPMRDFTINKCYVRGQIKFYSNITSVTVTNSIITESVNGNAINIANNLLVNNCYIGGNVWGFKPESDVMIDHCIIAGHYSTKRGIDDYNSQFYFSNCIFVSNAGFNNDVYPLVYNGCGSTFKKCIYQPGKSYRVSITGNGTVEDCYEVYLADMFADLEEGNTNYGSYTPNRSFEIKEPETWIGTDGTEIGIRGGAGWSKLPSTPVVKNLQLEVNGNTLDVTYDAEVR